MHLYRTRGPVVCADSPALPRSPHSAPTPRKPSTPTATRTFPSRAGSRSIGPFFKRGLMLLDFEEHMYHRRIMQEAFTRTRLAGYVTQVDRVATQVIANDWVADDARFLLYPAMKELTLDIASVVFMGHEPGSDHELVTKVNRAFTTTTRAGNAVIRTSVPPFTWWRGLRARKLLEEVLRGPGAEARPMTKAPTCLPCCVTPRTRTATVQRRRHRQPHDLPDDGRPRHLDHRPRARWPSTWPRIPPGRSAAGTSRDRWAMDRSTSPRWTPSSRLDWC